MSDEELDAIEAWCVKVQSDPKAGEDWQRAIIENTMRPLVAEVRRLRGENERVRDLLHRVQRRAREELGIDV